MKKLIISLVALSLVLSCSSDDDSDLGSDSGNNGTLLKTVKILNSGVALKTSTYEYFDNGNIKSISTFDVVMDRTIDNTFTYDQNDNIITVTIHKSEDPFGDTVDEVHNYEYTNGLISKSCIERNDTFSFTENEIDKIEFLYDSNNNITNYVHYYDEDADFYSCDDLDGLDFTETLEIDENNNMIRYQSDGFDFFGPSYFTYTYDDKNNPFENVNPIIFRGLLISYTTNNILTNTQYNSDNDEETGQGTYVYEYNDDDFPISLEKTFTTSDGISQITKIEYEYY